MDLSDLGLLWREDIMQRAQKSMEIEKPLESTISASNRKDRSYSKTTSLLWSDFENPRHKTVSFLEKRDHTMHLLPGPFFK